MQQDKHIIAAVSRSRVELHSVHATLTCVRAGAAQEVAPNGREAKGPRTEDGGPVASDTGGYVAGKHVQCAKSCSRADSRGSSSAVPTLCTAAWQKF